MLLGTLASVDLLMSLTPGWASTVFGWLALTVQMTGGAAAVVAISALRGRSSRDLGNLLLMFVMLQAYLQFMQWLIVWAENLPREIVWYLPRVQTGWGGVSIALIVLQFAVPMLALLFRSIKDCPRRLAAVAIGLLIAQSIGGIWLVVPSVEAHGYAAWWLAPPVMLVVALLAFAPLPGRSAAAHARS